MMPEAFTLGQAARNLSFLRKRESGYMQRFAFLWIWLLFPLFANAQIALTPGSELDVALVTFGPGE